MMHTSVPQMPNRADDTPVTFGIAVTAEPAVAPVDETLSIAVVAKRFGVDEKTVRRWGAQGLLRLYRVGPRLIRVDARDVDAMMRPIPTASQSA